MWRDRVGLGCHPLPHGQMNRNTLGGEFLIMPRVFIIALISILGLGCTYPTQKPVASRPAPREESTRRSATTDEIVDYIEQFALAWQGGCFDQAIGMFAPGWLDAPERSRSMLEKISASLGAPEFVQVDQPTPATGICLDFPLGKPPEGPSRFWYFRVEFPNGDHVFAQAEFRMTGLLKLNRPLELLDVRLFNYNDTNALLALQQCREEVNQEDSHRWKSDPSRRTEVIRTRTIIRKK